MHVSRANLDPEGLQTRVGSEPEPANDDSSVLLREAADGGEHQARLLDVDTPEVGVVAAACVSNCSELVASRGEDPLRPAVAPSAVLPEEANQLAVCERAWRVVLLRDHPFVRCPHQLELETVARSVDAQGSIFGS